MLYQIRNCFDLPLSVYIDVGYREDNVVGRGPLCVSHDVGMGEHIAFPILNFLS